MGKDAPELAGTRQRFHIRQHGSACRGKPGCNLEHSVNIMGDIPAQHQRQRPDETERDPHQTDSREALSGIDLRAFRLQAEQQHESQRGRQGDRQREAEHVFSIDQSHDQRQQQEGCQKQQHRAEDPCDHAAVHFPPSRIWSRPVRRPAAVTITA